MARPIAQSDDRSPYFDGPDRRNKPRKNVIEVELVTVDLGQGQGALLLDISESGMGVQALPGIQLGSSVPVSFDLPDTREHVEGTGTIVWNDRGGRAGVLFRDLAAPVKARLRNWLNQAQPAVQLAPEPEPASQESAIFLALGSENLGELDYLRDQIAGLEVNSALAVIAEQARVMARATGLAIALSDSTSYVCRASTGSAPAVGVRLHLNAGLSGECIRTGQIVRCEDTESDPRVDPVVCQRMGLRSAVLVPLKREEILVGVLEAFSDHPNAFASADVLMLRRVAELIIDIGGSEVTAAEEWSAPPAQAAAPEPPAAESAKLEASPLPMTPVSSHAGEAAPPAKPDSEPVPSPAVKPEAPVVQAAAAPAVPVAPVAEPVKTPAAEPAAQAAPPPLPADKFVESSKAAPPASVDRLPAPEKPAAKPLPPTPAPAASGAGNERLKPVVSPAREAVIPVATPAPSKLPAQGKSLVPQAPAPIRPPAVEIPETKPSPQFDVPHTFLEQEQTPADPRVRKALQIAAILLAVVLGSWFLYREGTSRPAGKPAAPAPGQQAQNPAPAPPVVAPSAPAASANTAAASGNRASAKASREKATPEQAETKAESGNAARETAPMVLPPSNRPAEPEEVVVRPVPPAPEDVAVRSAPPGLPAPSVTSPVMPAPPRPAPAVAANVSAPAEGASAAPARPVSKGVTGGRLLRRVEPSYPPMGRSMNLQGAVQLRATVTPKGTVAKMTVVRGQPVLAQAAMDAVRQWRYEPFSLDGTPVQMDVDIIVYFTIPR